MKRIVFRINELPDLSLSKYESLSDSGVEGVLERHKAFLRQWNRIGILNKISIHLLYAFDPELSAGKRLEIFFILQGEESGVEAGASILPFSPLSDYYSFERIDEKDCLSKSVHGKERINKYKSCTALIKKERVIAVEKDENNVEEFYFVPQWKVNEDARMYDLYKMISAIGTAFANGIASAYRIDLYPEDLSFETQNAFKSPMAKLRKFTQYSNDKISLVGNRIRKNKDENGNEVLKCFEDWIGKIETTPYFRVNIYGFSNTLVNARMILGAAGSEAMAEGDYSLLKIGSDNGDFDRFTRMDEGPRNYCTSETGRKNWSSLNSWSTTFTCEEVLPFFRLPALFEGEVIEIPKETAPKADGKGVLIANDTNNFDVRFPIEKLTKHAMIAGVPGAGKTNTMLHLLSLLWKQDKDNRVPFLVFEPAKKEYRALLNDGCMKDVLLFSPKMATKFPLRINPFQFPVNMVLSEHINTLMNVFSGSFELPGSTYFFLDRAIEKAYLERGWDVDTVNDNTLEYPRIQDVYVLLEKEINDSDYDGELRGNLKSFLQVRLGGLMKRDAGEIFNTYKSTLKPEEWLYIPAVIELESLGEQDKNFLILLLCSLIMESLRVNPNEDLDKKVRHAIFIEEAHNIISNTTQQSSAENIDPKISATAFIVKMLAEVRALREAMIITDQLPSVLAPEVMKNTGLKIVHRLTSKDDREIIGATMSASAMQIDALTTYKNGEALLFYESLQKPFKATICKWSFEGVEELENKIEGDRYIPKENNELFKYLCKQEVFKHLITEDRLLQSNAFLNEELLPFTDEYYKTDSVIDKINKELVTLGNSSEASEKHGSLAKLKQKYELLSKKRKIMLPRAEKLLRRIDKKLDLLNEINEENSQLLIFRNILTDIINEVNKQIEDD